MLKKINLNYLFIVIFLLTVIFFIFEIILYEDRLLPNLDNLHAFRSLENYFIFKKPFSEFYDGMSYNWDKYDLFNYVSVFLDFIIFKLLNLPLTYNFFYIFKIIFKFLILFYFYILFIKIFNSKIIALSSTLLLLIDGNFTHVLHNSHHYLIFLNLIIFSVIYFEKPKNIYFNNFIIGILLSLGCLSIIVTGIMWGFISLILLTFFCFKSKINFIQILFFLGGSLIVTALYTNTNLKEILILLDGDNHLSFDKNFLFYNIKYSLFNIYHLFYGQHGNNFLFLFLIIIFLNRHVLINEFDKNLVLIIFIASFIFLFCGAIIDPLHYYTSRLGIITPFAIYLLFKIYENNNKNFNFLKENLNFWIIIIFFIFSISKKILEYKYDPNTLLVAIYTVCLSGLILFIFILNNKIVKNYKLYFIVILFCFTFSLKYFPDYKVNQISSINSKKNNKEVFLVNNINNLIINFDGECITTNYPIYSLFNNLKLMVLSAVNSHSNKKEFWGDKNCDLIIFILNNNKSDLNQFTKINFLKKDKNKIEFNIDSKVYYKNSRFKVLNIAKHKKVEIYSFIKVKNIDEKDKDIIYFSH